MKKKWILSIFIGLFILFANGCQEVENPISPSIEKSSNGIHQALSKTVWLTSSIYTTGYETSFNFEGFNYRLTWTFDYTTGTNGVTTAKFYVDDQLLTTKYYYWDYDNPPSSYWTGYYSTNGSHKFRLYLFWYEGGSGGTLVPRLDVDKIQVQTIDYEIDKPTNFNASPGGHSNLSQAVTLSWTASSDTDVTGYEIYRRRYSVNTGYDGAFAVIQTISSRTTSSWIDTSVKWRFYQQAEYKIKAVSSTLNMESSFAGPDYSWLTAYEDQLP